MNASHLDGLTVNRQTRSTFDPEKAPGDMYVRRMVLRADCSLKANARLVAVAIAERLSRDDSGRWVAFMGQRDIADRTGLSVETVRRTFRELKAMDPPLFAMPRGGVTKGRAHSCYRFELLRNPAAFKRALEAEEERRRLKRTEERFRKIAPGISKKIGA